MELLVKDAEYIGFVSFSDGQIDEYHWEITDTTGEKYNLSTYTKYTKDKLLGELITVIDSYFYISKLKIKK